MGAFLSSQGTFTIVVPHESVGYERAVAFDISRNLYQYFAADTDIVDEVPQIRIGNIVLLANSSTELPSTGRRFPISVTDTHLSIMNAAGRTNRYKLEEGMGAIFLYPLLGEQLMLVVWGTDEAGLRAAARLVPLRTGVGQPDFIVVGRESGWAGVDGVKALGMFDSLVEVTPASFM